MFQFAILSTLLGVSTAVVYGGDGSGYGASGYGNGKGSGGGGHGAAIIPAAVISNHQIRHFNVPSSGFVQPTTIDVPANFIPVNFVFRSASSLIHVAQKHESAPGSFHESHSQDDAHKLVHTVTKPIIQEVREIISPFRRVTQTVEPVREEVQTIVARNAGGGAGGFGGGKGGKGGAYGGGTVISTSGYGNGISAY